MAKTKKRSISRQHTQHPRGETTETRVWLQFAVDCKYLDSEQIRPLYAKYDEILTQLVHLIENPSH